jgi:hypothetical protein
MPDWRTNTVGPCEKETHPVAAVLALLLVVALVSSVFGGLVMSREGGQDLPQVLQGAAAALALSPLWLLFGLAHGWWQLLCAVAVWTALDRFDRHTPGAATLVGGATGLLAWLHPGRTMFREDWSWALFLGLGASGGLLLWRLAYREPRRFPYRTLPRARPLVLDA